MPNASLPIKAAALLPLATLAFAVLCAGCQSLNDPYPRAQRSPRLVAGLGAPGQQPTAERAGGETEAGDEDAALRDPNDVWQRLAQRCVLVRSTGINDRIAQQRAWLLGNRGFLNTASTRAQPYLHYIVERLEERRMPMELALLPMIESAYNPMANSSAAAAGLWQFVPATGRDFNLSQTAAYDARRDVIASSTAAMDYLTRLNAQFDGDWLLALAAYNAGEGTVGRAIENNRRQGLPTDYWHLALPQQTQDYVPRLLALSLLVRHPGSYGVSLAPVANTPYFEVLELNHSVDIPRLAATAGIDETQLLGLNPAFLHKRTPDGPGRLLVPKAQKRLLAASVAKLGPAGPSAQPVPTQVGQPAAVASTAAGPIPTLTANPRAYRRVPQPPAREPRVVVFASTP